LGREILAFDVQRYQRDEHGRRTARRSVHVRTENDVGQRDTRTDGVHLEAVDDGHADESPGQDS
jgi:hypothetical protein